MDFSPLLLVCVLWPAASSSCLDRPPIMECDLELWASISPFSIKLLFVKVFYHSNKTKTRAAHIAFVECFLKWVSYRLDTSILKYLCTEVSDFRDSCILEYLHGLSWLGILNPKLQNVKLLKYHVGVQKPVSSFQLGRVLPHISIYKPKSQRVFESLENRFQFNCDKRKLHSLCVSCLSCLWYAALLYGPDSSLC